MHHRHDFRTRAVDLAVDVALDEAFPLVAGGGLAVRAELHQVRGSDERRRARARHEEMPGPLVAARAHMSIGVEHAVPGEDAAAGDQVVDQLLACGGLLHFSRISLMCGAAKQSTTTAVMEVSASATEAPRTPSRSASGPARNAPIEIIAG